MKDVKIKICLYVLCCVVSIISIANYQVTHKKFYYEYDINGNIIKIITIARQDCQQEKTTQFYIYNSLNQMVGFSNIQNNESYGYDYYPNGRRSAKCTNSQTGTESIAFLYGHQGNLLNEEYSQNSQLQKRSSYFAGIRFVDDLINSNDSIFQLPLADRHNHPATISFSQGQSHIQSYHLTDYGQLSQSNINNNTNGNVSNNDPLIDFSLNPKVYGSGYYDPESKLQYMGARYYSADSHRFMAQDSYNLLNRYNYANANPVMNYDPDGHSAVGDFAKGIANGFIPHGAKGWGALGASVVADVAITGALLASAAAPGVGTMTLIGALSGGASNAFGVAVGNVISGDQQNAYDLASQAVLGAAIGGVISFSAPTVIKSLNQQSGQMKTVSNAIGHGAKALTFAEQKIFNMADDSMDLINKSINHFNDLSSLLQGARGWQMGRSGSSFFKAIRDNERYYLLCINNPHKNSNKIIYAYVKQIFLDQSFKNSEFSNEFIQTQLNEFEPMFKSITENIIQELEDDKYPMYRAKYLEFFGVKGNVPIIVDGNLNPIIGRAIKSKLFSG